jgi:1-phosphofructokinase family hexose kinase
MIVAAGLSPAWQRIMQFARLTPGEVNRAAQVVECASGKVLNVGRAVQQLGIAVRTVAPIGGATGEAIAAEFAREQLAASWVRTAAPTRTCTTLLDTEQGTVTELVENAGPLTEVEVDAFISEFRIAAEQAELVALTGSLPPGVPRDCYARLMKMTPARAILDARGPELLAALLRRPFLVKPNRSELEQTCKRSLADEAALLAAMRHLNRLGAEWVLVTQGAGPAWLTSRQETYRFDPPLLERPVNPIGCGDCLTAGIAVAMTAGRPLPEAVAYGLAAASQNAAELLPARLQRDKLDPLERAVLVTPQSNPSLESAT